MKCLTIFNSTGHLTIYDSREVLNAIWEARCKWHSIAIQLGQRADNLDVIKIKCRDDPEDCFREVIHSWLRGDNPTPTWSALAATLRTPTVGFGQLAESIESKEHSNTHQCDGVLQYVEEINGQDSSSEIFRCPCHKCSLESYLEHGCPSSTSKRFPYLDVSNLDDCDREDLEQRLISDVSEIVRCFAELFDATCTSLTRREVSVERLAVRAVSLGAYESPLVHKPLITEAEIELRTSTSIYRAFLVLRPYMSYFNFGLLEHIINGEVCLDDDRRRMSEYKNKFQEFCGRKVVEVPPDLYGLPQSEIRSRKRKAFAVLVTRHEAEPNLVFVNMAKHRIGSILHLKSSTLHLHRIDIGCLLLVFSLPEFVFQWLFPIDTGGSLESKLKEEGFIVFVTKSSEVNFVQADIHSHMEQLYYSKFPIFV